MVRDNSPKERQKKQLERKAARRAPHDRILIVSEGSKTEPLYFEDIRSEYRLHTANVVVRPSDLGTAPIQVVRYAEQLFENGDRHKGIRPRAFERVYAVFDRDEHESHFEALNVAQALDGSSRTTRRNGSNSKQWRRFHVSNSGCSYTTKTCCHHWSEARSCAV